MRHNCLIYNTLPSGNEWHFDGPGGKSSITVSGTYQSNNGMAIRDMLLAGIGLARSTTFVVGEALQSGALITVLEIIQPNPIPSMPSTPITGIFHPKCGRSWISSPSALRRPPRGRYW